MSDRVEGAQGLLQCRPSSSACSSRLAASACREAIAGSVASHRLRASAHACSSPTKPRRKATTQTTKMTPMMTVTHSPTRSESRFCRPMIVNAPSTGPANVPMPPSRVIRTTSPDSDQCASDSVAKPSTSVLSEPPRPASAGRQDEGEQLVAVDVVAERDRARLVLADRLQHLAVGRMDDAADEQEDGDEDGEDDEVHDDVVGDRQHAEQLVVRRAGERQHAEQLAARNALQAVLAAGDRAPLQEDEVDHLARARASSSRSRCPGGGSR